MTHSWLADKIEQWPTVKLVPYARNARTHSDAQVAQIAASIVEFGFTNPILAGSDGVIVAGHGRLAAAQKLGLVVVVRHPALQHAPALALAGVGWAPRLALNPLDVARAAVDAAGREQPHALQPDLRVARVVLAQHSAFVAHQAALRS